MHVLFVGVEKGGHATHIPPDSRVPCRQDAQAGTPEGSMARTRVGGHAARAGARRVRRTHVVVSGARTKPARHRHWSGAKDARGAVEKGGHSSGLSAPCGHQWWAGQREHHV